MLLEFDKYVDSVPSVVAILQNLFGLGFESLSAQEFSQSSVQERFERGVFLGQRVEPIMSLRSVTEGGPGRNWTRTC